MTVTCLVVSCDYHLTVLADVSTLFLLSYPILKGHMSIQLGQSHNTNTISAVQKLVRVAVQETSLNEPFTIVQGWSDSCMSRSECLM